MKIDRLLKAAISLLLFSLLPFFACSADDPVAKFEKLMLEAKIATNTSTPVYLNRNCQKWAKRRFSGTDIKYDVKKTDSLANPIIGLVTFQLVIEQTDLYPTKEEAEASSTFKEIPILFRISLTYSYKDNTWSFLKGSDENESLSGWLKGEIFFYDLSEEGIRDEPTAIPNVAILYWLPR